MSRTDRTTELGAAAAAPAPGLLPRLLGPAATVRGGLALMVVGLVDSVGTGLYLAGSAVFFSLVVGLSSAQVGLGLSVAGVLGLVAQPLIGRLADHWGARRVLVLLHIWRAGGFLAFLAVRDFTGFVLATAVIGVGQQALSPVYQALVEQIVGAEQRVAMMARSRVVYNVGFSVGALLASGAIGIGSEFSFDLIMLGTGVSCLVAAVLLGRLEILPAATRPADGKRRSRYDLGALRDLRYMALAAVNGVLSLHIALLGVGIPLWVTLHTSAPRGLVGLLLVVNTVLAVLFQVRASRGSETLAGSVSAMRKAGPALALCCVVLALTPNVSATAGVVALLVLGVVALTTAELYQSAGGWGLSFALAPDEARAEYLSTFNLGVSAQFVVGPTIVTLGVIDQGTVGWLALAGCLLGATALVGPLAAGRPAAVAADGSVAAEAAVAADAAQT